MSDPKATSGGSPRGEATSGLTHRVRSGAHPRPSGATRRTARLVAGTTNPDEPTIVVIPFTVGPHRLVIEAARVIEVVQGARVLALAAGDESFVHADVHALLETFPVGSHETLVARADGGTGRGPGPRVAFLTDGAERLLAVPLESVAPFPDIVRERIEVDFLVGTVALEAGGVAFLVDPARLARSARSQAAAAPPSPAGG